MACQFGCGSKGKLANFEASGDHCIQGNNPSKPNGGSSPTNDGNGVCVATYLKKGADYNVSCFTSGAQDKQGNGGCPSPANASGGVLASNASTAASQLPSTASQPAGRRQHRCSCFSEPNLSLAGAEILVSGLRNALAPAGVQRDNLDDELPS
jgi:hypothetical protein